MKPLSSFLLRCCLLFGLSGPVSAQTPDMPPVPDNPASASGHASPATVGQARKAIDAVLAEPEFGRNRTVKVPRFKKSSADGEKKSSADGKKNFLETFFDWLSKRLRSLNSPQTPSSDPSQSIVQAGQIALWSLVFVLIALLVIYSKHWLPFLGWQRSRANPSIFTAYQSDSAIEIAVALPDDIAMAAERCWNEGKKEEALSLLYRGAIELLTKRHRIEPPQGATEEEIRLLVGNAMPSFKECFGNIVRAWLRLAYAHRAPADITDLLAEFGRLQQEGRGVS
jgi:hypothetical protein